MQQHLSLLNKHVNTVKDVPAHEFIQVFAQHLKQINKFKIPDVSTTPSVQPKRRDRERARPHQMCASDVRVSVNLSQLQFLIKIINNIVVRDR